MRATPFYYRVNPHNHQHFATVCARRGSAAPNLQVIGAPEEGVIFLEGPLPVSALTRWRTDENATAKVDGLKRARDRDILAAPAHQRDQGLYRAASGGNVLSVEPRLREQYRCSRSSAADTIRFPPKFTACVCPLRDADSGGELNPNSFWNINHLTQLKCPSRTIAQAPHWPSPSR